MIYRQDSYLTIPFAKDSPFTKPVMETFEKLRGHGVIDHVWRNYLPVIDKEKCKETKVMVSKSVFYLIVKMQLFIFLGFTWVSTIEISYWYFTKRNHV